MKKVLLTVLCVSFAAIVASGCECPFSKKKEAAPATTATTTEAPAAATTK